MEPYCFIIKYDFDSNAVFDSIEKAYLFLTKVFVAAKLAYSPLEAHFEDDTSQYVDIKQFIEPVQITEQARQKICQDIDELIIKNEKRIVEMMKGHGRITGWFGITSKDREESIENEIKIQSVRWKDATDIDFDNLIYTEQQT